MHYAGGYTTCWDGASGSFVVCDKRDDINRVEVSAERLRQWRCGAEAVGAFVVKALDCGLRANGRRMPGCGSLAL